MSKHENIDSLCVKKTTVGGQALIEGLMMLGPHKTAMAVRLPNGEIHCEEMENQKQWAIEKIPFVRGSVKLVRQLAVGMKTLFRSADLAETEAVVETGETNPIETSSVDETVGELQAELTTDSGQDNSEAPLAEVCAVETEMEGVRADEAEIPAETKAKSVIERFFERYPEAYIYVSLFISLGISVALFIFLPNFCADMIRRLFAIPLDAGRGWQLLLTFVEGIVRIIVFIGYLGITRMNKEVLRVWQYHGAEHKTIACYEAGEELTVENIRKFSRLHPRCGTSFMFLVMLVSIIVLAFVGWKSAVMNLVARLILLPVIAGLTYELTRLTGRSSALWSRILRWPGLKLQLLTTAEPDDSMLEVAIVAVNAVIPNDDSDRW